MTRRAITWQDIYRRHIKAGDDPTYAAHAADEWARRKERKAQHAADGTTPKRGRPRKVPS